MNIIARKRRVPGELSAAKTTPVTVHETPRTDSTAKTQRKEVMVTTHFTHGSLHEPSCVWEEDVECVLEECLRGLPGRSPWFLCCLLPLDVDSLSWRRFPPLLCLCWLGRGGGIRGTMCEWRMSGRDESNWYGGDSALVDRRPDGLDPPPPPDMLICLYVGKLGRDRTDRSVTFWTADEDEGGYRCVSSPLWELLSGM